MSFKPKKPTGTCSYHEMTFSGTKLWVSIVQNKNIVTFLWLNIFIIFCWVFVIIVLKLEDWPWNELLLTFKATINLNTFFLSTNYFMWALMPLGFAILWGLRSFLVIYKILFVRALPVYSIWYINWLLSFFMLVFKYLPLSCKDGRLTSMYHWVTYSFCAFLLNLGKIKWSWHRVLITGSVR